MAKTQTERQIEWRKRLDGRGIKRLEVYVPESIIKIVEDIAKKEGISKGEALTSYVSGRQSQAGGKTYPVDNYKAVITHRMADPKFNLSNARLVLTAMMGKQATEDDVKKLMGNDAYYQLEDREPKVIEGGRQDADTIRAEITKLRDKGMTWQAVADDLNGRGWLSARSRAFTDENVKKYFRAARR